MVPHPGKTLSPGQMEMVGHPVQAWRSGLPGLWSGGGARLCASSAGQGTADKLPLATGCLDEPGSSDLVTAREWTKTEEEAKEGNFTTQ